MKILKIARCIPFPYPQVVDLRNDLFSNLICFRRSLNLATSEFEQLNTGCSNVLRNESRRGRFRFLRGECTGGGGPRLPALRRIKDTQ